MNVSGDVQAIVDTVRDWCERSPVRLCVLFGSQVSGRTHAGSDVDLAVWPVDVVSPATRLRWLNQLETALASPVSLVLVSPDLDPVLGFEIARQGLLIFESTADTWPEQRAQLWHCYNDSSPFRRAARQRLHEFAEEVRDAL